MYTIKNNNWIIIALTALAVGVKADAATLAAATAGTLSSTSGITVPITLALGGAEKVAAIQFDLQFDVNSIKLVAVNTGSAAAAAGKSASSYELSKGKHRIIIIGMNQHIMGNGPVAVLRIDIVPATPTGVYPLTLSNVIFSNPVGIAIHSKTVSGSITVGGPANPQILPKEDPPSGGCFGGILSGKQPPTKGSGGILLVLPLVLLILYATLPTPSLRLGRSGLTPQTMWTSPRQPCHLAPRNDVIQ
ncbi:MAG TPA: cohesin domain-containing protein [Candidatus Hydrogenedentes bacterium]|nr:cohesin domain-containing protein [Candidatus Hydrogenedentota bacterium]